MDLKALNWTKEIRSRTRKPAKLGSRITSQAFPHRGQLPNRAAWLENPPKHYLNWAGPQCEEARNAALKTTGCYLAMLISWGTKSVAGLLG